MFWSYFFLMTPFQTLEYNRYLISLHFWQLEWSVVGILKEISWFLGLIHSSLTAVWVQMRAPVKWKPLFSLNGVRTKKSNMWWLQRKLVTHPNRQINVLCQGNQLHPQCGNTSRQTYLLGPLTDTSLKAELNSSVKGGQSYKKRTWFYRSNATKTKEDTPDVKSLLYHINHRTVYWTSMARSVRDERGRWRKRDKAQHNSTWYKQEVPATLSCSPFSPINKIYITFSRSAQKPTQTKKKWLWGISPFSAKNGK